MAEHSSEAVVHYLDNIENQAFKEALVLLRDCIKQHLPPGFSEGISYGMIGYVVSHDVYPSGYHCNPKLPLPFLSIAAQKNFIALYHMGIYADKDLMSWFTEQWPKHSGTKLDMGKSCIRFKKPESIPYALIGQLLEKMTVNQWIALYEKQLKTS
jgi:hypothetical protein